MEIGTSASGQKQPLSMLQILAPERLVSRHTGHSPLVITRQSALISPMRHQYQCRDIGQYSPVWNDQVGAAQRVCSWFVGRSASISSSSSNGFRTLSGPNRLSLPTFPKFVSIASMKDAERTSDDSGTGIPYRIAAPSRSMSRLIACFPM